MKKARYYIYLPVLLVLAYGISSFISLEKEPPKGSDYSVDFYKFSNRGAVIKTFYNQALDKNKALKKLDEEVSNALTGPKISSWNGFFTEYHQYKRVANDFYEQANHLNTMISDSLLRKKVEALVSKSTTDFQEMTQNQDRLLEKFNQNQQKINDLYLALKIVKSMEEVELFQKENLPAEALFNEKIKPQDLLINQLQKEIN